MSTTAARSNKSKGGRPEHNRAAYRSGLEDSLAKQLQDKGLEVNYEQYTLRYIKPAKEHRYTPDFVLHNNIIIESKGFFTPDDRIKHLIIKEQYPDLDIRFVFSRSTTKLNKRSKTTYGAWCEKHGFAYADKLIPEEWLKEEPKASIPEDILVKSPTKTSKTCT